MEIDLISVEGKPYVTEVNASPGFKGLLNATGVNAVKSMMEYAANKAEH